MHAEAPGPSTPAGKALRILVIEDNTDTADSAHVVLTLLGYECAVAYTGPGGLDKARAWRPHVIVCDLGLPGVDGYQLATTFRKDQATAKAMLVAVTGYAGPEIRKKALEAGFQHYLPKPVDWAELQRILEGAKNSGTPSEPAASP